MILFGKLYILYKFVILILQNKYLNVMCIHTYIYIYMLLLLYTELNLILVSYQLTDDLH